MRCFIKEIYQSLKKDHLTASHHLMIVLSLFIITFPPTPPAYTHTLCSPPCFPAPPFHYRQILQLKHEKSHVGRSKKFFTSISNEKLLTYLDPGVSELTLLVLLLFRWVLSTILYFVNFKLFDVSIDRSSTNSLNFEGTKIFSLIRENIFPI